VSSYTVTFHTNGGTPADFTQQVQSGGKVTLPSPAPTRDGYTLDGWFTDAAGTGAAWDFDKDTVTTNIGLYAKWTRNAYKVTFDTGDAEHTPAPLENVLYYDKITAPVITKTGYTLDGWYKEAAKTTKWDFALNTVKENITLYGTWIKNSIVTFNTGEGGSIVPALEVPHGSAATKPANPTRTGYAFDNWYATNADTPYNFDSPVTADITLYAKWKPLTLAAAIVYMAETANSPASVVIDGGNRVVTGSTNSFTIGSGVTITLKNITFKTLPFTVSAGGTLVLDNGAVIRDNTETGVTVTGTSATAKGTLEMRDGASVINNTGGAHTTLNMKLQRAEACM
jgi:uncharacterized repeat protein (TIGR02543 family)